MTDRAPFDVAVVGAGPAGSTAASFLREKGLSVMLIERASFPRFQIGESLLPYNNDLFEKLGVWDKVLEGDFVEKYGAEFNTGCKTVSQKFRFSTYLPDKYHMSFQVRRSSFDQMLLDTAVERGTEVLEGWTVTSVDLDDPERVRLEVARGGEKKTFDARFLVDATGADGILARISPDRTDRTELRKIAIFAHYKGVVPGGEGRDAGNIVITVLRNGWSWLIPIDRETTSFGLVVDRDAFVRANMKPAEILEETIRSTPYLADRLGSAERVSEIHARKDFSYRMKTMHGDNWVVIGDAAGFIDPIFSTGVFIAMKSAEIAADAVDRRLRTGSTRELKRYQRKMRTALGRYLVIIRHFYRREFVEVFLNPKETFGLVEVVIGLLAGNAFERNVARWRLGIFYALVRIQGWLGVIAPRIPWNTLPMAHLTSQSEGQI